jgi:hypothetical protein
MKITKRFAKLSIWNKLGVIGGLASIFGIIIGILPFFFKDSINISDIQPFETVIKENIIETYNQKKTLLWIQKIDGNISKAIIDDINRDNKKEVIIGIDGIGVDSGKIICYDFDGDIIWSTDTAMRFNYTGGRSGKMCIRDFVIFSSDNDKNKYKYIISLSIDYQGWYQSVVSMLTYSGKRIAYYWNPGHLHFLKVGKQLSTFSNLVVIGGISNDLSTEFEGKGYNNCVFLVNPLSMSGEAPPYFGFSTKGTHIWYGIIIPKGENITKIDIIDFNQDGANEISIWTDKGHSLYLDFQGRLLSKGFSDGAIGNIDWILVK